MNGSVNNPVKYPVNIFLITGVRGRGEMYIILLINAQQPLIHKIKHPQTLSLTQLNNTTNHKTRR